MVNRQRGQLALYGTLGVGVVLLLMGVALKVQTSRLHSLQAEYEGFKAQVKVLGEQAEKAKQAKEAADKANKERIDNETKKLRSVNADLSKRLRDQRASSGFLPSTGSPAGSPQAITFDRTKLERAIQQLDAGVSSLIERGDQAVIDLNLSLKWASEIK